MTFNLRGKIYTVDVTDEDYYILNRIRRCEGEFAAFNHWKKHIKKPVVKEQKQDPVLYLFK